MAEAKTRELNYVMVQHMGYAPETRAERHLRPGQRRMRLSLGNGRRIRNKGDRYDEVAFDEVLANFEMLCSGIQSGALQVCRPDNLEAFTLPQFVDLGRRLAEDARVDLKVDKTVLEPLVGSDLKDKQVWVEKTKTEQPPVDNDHVAPGAEQFSPETIAAAAEAAAAATTELSAPSAPAKPVESQPIPAATPAPKAEDTNPKHPGKKGRR